MGRRRSNDYDLVLAGGGLANSLIAWWLKCDRPELEVLVLESSGVLGGEHTWCFHAQDVSPVALERLGQVVVGRWEHQRVIFKGLDRTVESPYYAVRSNRLHEVLSVILGDSVRYGVRVETLSAHSVACSDGTHYTAGLVIDGRGGAPAVQPSDRRTVSCGFQTFVGLDLKFNKPHGLKNPILIDATRPCAGLYRFFYVLPWDESTALVEDTKYQLGQEHDRVQSERDIVAYATDKLGQVEQVLRRESGCLSIPFVQPRTDSSEPSSGLRAGLFHPTTGYSLGDAVRFAQWLSSCFDSSSEFADRVACYQRSQQRKKRFYRFLNRMMFLGCKPERICSLFEKFYRMDVGRIERFYAGRSTCLDRAVILSGKPPLSPLKALRLFPEPRQAIVWKTV